MTDRRPALSTTEAAQILGVSDETIKRYIISGDLSGFKLPGGHFRIHADSVDKMMEPSQRWGKK